MPDEKNKEVVIELIDTAEMLAAIPEELYPEDYKYQLFIRIMLRRLEVKLYPEDYPPDWATTQEIYEC